MTLSGMLPVPGWGNSMKSIVYLAAPLTHPDVKVMRMRERLATEAAAYLVATEGLVVLSPLTSTCPISRAMHELYGVKDDSHMAFLSQDFWVNKFDRKLLEACNTLAILCLEGWEDSVGIKTEIEIARCNDIEIVHLFPIFHYRHIAHLRWTEPFTEMDMCQVKEK